MEMSFESAEIVYCLSEHCKSTWRFFSAFCMIFPSVSLVKRQVILKSFTDIVEVFCC